MIWPIAPTFVVEQQIVANDDRRPLRNRTQRRARHYGKQPITSKYQGRLSPKQQRELGV